MKDPPPPPPAAFADLGIQGDSDDDRRLDPNTQEGQLIGAAVAAKGIPSSLEAQTCDHLQNSRHLAGEKKNESKTNTGRQASMHWKKQQQQGVRKHRERYVQRRGRNYLEKQREQNTAKAGAMAWIRHNEGLDETQTSALPPSNLPGAVAIGGTAMAIPGMTDGAAELEDLRLGCGGNSARTVEEVGAVAVVGQEVLGDAATPDYLDDSPVGDRGNLAALSPEGSHAIAIPTAEVVDDDADLQMEREENERLALENEKLKNEVDRHKRQGAMETITLPSSAVVARRVRSTNILQKLKGCLSDWRIVAAVLVILLVVTIVVLVAIGQFSSDNGKHIDDAAIPPASTSRQKSNMCSIPCKTTADCEEKLQLGSVCQEKSGLESENRDDNEGRVQKCCTNPFASGCLRQMQILKEKEDNSPESKIFTKRVCNSDDEDKSGNGNCVPARSMEVRIAPGDWDSSIFLAWVFQIFLSEILGIPVTIENGKGSDALSFYDPDPNAFDVPNKAYNWEALREAHKVKDCRRTSKECAYFLPEVWDSQESKWIDLHALGEVEYFWSGIEGEISMYIPKFVAEMDPSLVSSNGMSGESNRKKLADIFKRPTTWLDYCREVSSTNCTSSDGAAARWPSDPDEEGRYFVQDLYTGHFRATDENNCDKNPSTCTGHFVDASCEWTTYSESQLFWNKIALQSDGPLKPNGAYTGDAMAEIWSASNATGSPVIMWRWNPDKLLYSFSDSPNEFQPISLPKPTLMCTKNRVNNENQCSENIHDRLGLEEGSCDYVPHKLQKVISKSIKGTAKSAYNALRSVQIDEEDIEEMMKAWILQGGEGYAEAREAVCGWVADNVDLLQSYTLNSFDESTSAGSGICCSWLLWVFLAWITYGLAVVSWFPEMA
uniref:Uncharacterized protein n=1 Tax=Odontella aurita TaxID=265563 RepID=A0A7S4JDL3_9STRA